MNTFIVCALAFAVILDLKLILAHEPTISQRYQRLFPTWFDIFTLALLIPLLCHSLIHPTLKVLLAVTAGHLFWPNKELYK